LRSINHTQHGPLTPLPKSAKKPRIYDYAIFRIITGDAY